MKHFISSLSVINANTPPCEGRVSSRKILSLLLILFLSIGNVWAETKNDVVSAIGFAGITENGYTTAGTDYSAVANTTNNTSVTYAMQVFDGKTGAVRGNSSGNANFSCRNTTTCDGYYISKVVLTVTGGTLDGATDNRSVVYFGTSAYANPTTAPTGTSTKSAENATGTTLTWNNTNEEASYFILYNLKTSGTLTGGQVTITWTKKSGGTTPDPGTPVASLSATPTTIDFGTVYQGEDVESKTVAVNFANLNGDVTYSVLSTPFSATGNISTTGDNITISAVASTIGEYSQTLTVASTADSKTAEVTVKMNVVAAPAPTGTFTLHTGDLMEGDYVIYYSGKAMKAEVASNRLQYVEVTPSNDEIVDPAAAAIWHIAKSGDNWTVYNNNAGYAAGTGTKSQAGLVANLTGDDANKAAWTVTASGNAYEFVNVWNTSKSVNATLRNNGTYGFACYATSTGGALSLYRKAGTKYNVTVSSTTNGSVTANPTSAEAGTIIALTVTPESGYVLDALTVTDASSNTIEVADNKFTMPASDVTVTATFKENEKPAATLTLSKNGETEDITGHKQGDKVELPSITSDCVKEFVGWSANPTCNVAPEYAAGDSYTLAATAQTLYAVYATVGGGETLTITPSAVDNDAENDIHTFTIDAAGYSLTAKKNSGSSAPTINASAKDVRIYAKGTVTLTAPKAMGTIVFNLSAQGKQRLAPITASVGTIAPQASGDAIVTWTGDATEVTFTVGDKADFGSDGSSKGGQLCFSTITVTTVGSYSNYSTTCAAAPKAEVNPTSVTANAAGANDKVEVTYENVNTKSVAVALFNDEACTEVFSADWLTASLDGDKNIAYTVAATTLYTERKAYIKLTAPETTGATGPAVVVIPVTQAGKDKVFASLAELVAADLAKDDAVTVTLTNDVIKEFYIYNSKRAGVVFDVQKGGEDIKIYFNNQTTIDDWAVGGKLSGTLTNVKWTTYSNAWQLAPDYNTWAWANLTYTEPKAVSTVVVSGAPTKTTYVDGEAFDPAGLTVTVNYNDATSEVNPTGVTFTVTPATLVKGQTSVSVTATFNSVSSAAYEVTGLTVNDIPTKTVAEFIAAGGIRCYLEGIVSNITNTTYGNFDLTDASGTIYVNGCLNAAGESKKFAELDVKNGDKIKVIADEYELYNDTKDEAINVQYVSHISAATITIENITLVEGDEHTIVAVVTPAEAEGKVTYSIESGSEYISLAGNVITALAEGTATITATVAEGATYMGNSVDFTVTVKEYVAPISGIWELVTDASTLKAGDKVIVAQYVETDGAIYTMGVQKANNRDVVESSVSGTTLTPTTGTTVLTLVDAGNGTFALQVDNGKYLYAASNTSNHLKETATVNDNAKWSVSVTDGKASVVAQGANTHNTIRFNKSNTPKIFSCYESGQQDIALYKKMPDYTREVDPRYYGTICLPKAGKFVGGSLYEVAYYDETAKKVYFDEVLNGEMEAGMPYIFLANATKIEVYYASDEEAAAKDKNGLYGTLVDITSGMNADGVYMIYRNQIIHSTHPGSYLNANRAYIKLAEVPGYNDPSYVAPAPAPGRKRIAMGAQATNTATSVDQVQGDNVPTKMIINGQLFILRGEKMYDAQGKLVK